MSNKQDLQKALDALARAKKETANALNKTVESIRQTRQEQTEIRNRQS